MPLRFFSKAPVVLLTLWLCGVFAVLSEVGPVYPTDTEPLGPSSRRTALVISEIMYKPLPREDGKNLEFVELYNSDIVPLNISRFKLAGSIEFTFPTNRVIPARGYLVIARDTNAIRNVYGITNFIGPYTGSLGESGQVQLRNRQNALLLNVNYDSKPPYPVSAFGAGHSMVLARPSYGEGDPRAWGQSELVGGSPGKVEPPLFNHSSRPVLINEFLAHTDDPEVDFIELFNASSQAADLSGCFLSDHPSQRKFKIPAGTILPPRGWIAFDQNQLGFALSSEGESIFLVSSNETRVLDSIRFSAQANGISSGRYPDGAPNLQELRTISKAAPNSPRLDRPVVISEIMYNPILNRDELEYLELFNRSSTAINVAGWRFVDGIDFEFPSGASIPAGGYLVVAKNSGLLASAHSHLNQSNLFGNFKGTLSNKGERIALAAPDDVVSTNANNVVVTNTIWVVVEEVTYADGGYWGKWSDGGGSSLELVDARADNRIASNWADSDETLKAGWSPFEVTGVLDLGIGAPAGTPNSLQVFLQGAGEALLDDLEVINSNNLNVLLNGNFELANVGWFFQGTHDQSTVDLLLDPGAIGTQGLHSLHIVATARGDTGANRVRGTILSPPADGSVVTLRGRGRWLKGTPEVLMRLHGNQREVVGRLEVPFNLGTPGLPNSRAVSNAGPAVYDVTHRPALPAANESVVVTARVNDPDGISALNLIYRMEAPGGTTVAMNDQGLDGDAVAGDGLFSARIPGQPGGTGVAFRIEATDAAAEGILSRFPPAGPVFPQDLNGRECLVRFGESMPAGNLGSYRIWITQQTANRWTTREKNSNAPLDATFVYNNFRVIYNIDALYSGSPWHSPGFTGPTGAICDYVMRAPGDARFLGASDFVLASVGNLDNDTTAQLEQAAYWMAEQLNLPFLHRRYIHMYVNGTRRGRVYEDTQQPSSEFLEQWYPDDSKGTLHKIEDWFEFDETGDVKQSNVDGRLERYLTPVSPGSSERKLKLERYRWTFRKRAVQDSASNYDDLFRLVEAVNHTVPSLYTTSTEAQTDVEQWMRIFAIEHIVGNWDCYGYDRGKNMYAYKPENGKWQMLMWDIDFVLGLASHAPTHSLFAVNDPVIARMYNHPPFVRSYWRALRDAVNGPLKNENFDAFVDARYQALIQNGITVDPPNGAKAYVRDRRNYINSQMSQVASDFRITSNNGANFSTNRNTVLLAGTAPVQVKFIRVNGVIYPITWTTVKTWEIRISLNQASNFIRVEGLDSNGIPVPGAADTIAVSFSGTVPPAQDNLVINEIMYNSTSPGLSFIEIYNKSSTTSYGLNGFRIDGLSLSIKEGITIGPNEFMVFAKNPQAFGKKYGYHIPVAGTFSGELNNGGESIRLVKAGLTPSGDQLIDRVTYDDELPWPQAAAGQGASLQLIDPRQDNRRPANWSATLTGLGATPGATNSVHATLPVFDSIWINEIQPMQTSTLADNQGQFDPWIELHNSGAISIQLNQYYLTDTYTNLLKWQFPAGATLAPGQFLVVWIDGEPNQTAGSQYHANFRLNSTNGSIALVKKINEQPAVMDYYNYRNVGNNRSLGSIPDAQPDDREVFFIVTPGAPNNGGVPPVKINEWLATNTRTLADPADGKFDDWFELYNAGTVPVDLSGYTLTDNLTDPNKWRIPAGTVIPPKGFLLVWADEEPQQNTGSGDLHADFKLSASGEQIGLFTPGGAVVDTVTFAAQTADRSQGRVPDGGATLQFFDTPTPRVTNVSNRPPTLNPIGSRLVSQGQTLSFTAVANDPDAGQVLTFSLDPGAPAGATIHAASGFFTWTTSSTQPVGPYPVTIRVKDNGTPLMEASETFTITVSKESQISSFSWSAGKATMVFQTIPWRKYQVQYAESLVSPDWRNFGFVTTATSDSMTIEDTTASVPQRYYRIMEVP